MHFKKLKENSDLQKFPVIQEFSNLRIMTYNVWFDAHNKDNRYEAIIQMILMSNANVVCLQECTTIFLSKLVNNKHIKAKFKHYGF